MIGLLAQDGDAENGNGGEGSAEVDISCGNQGALCDALVEATGSEALGELLAFLIGVPIKIAIIVVVALLVNRLARNHVADLAEWLGETTTDHDSLVSEGGAERADERATTLGTLLRSLSSAVIFGVAFIMCLEAIGINATSAIASAGVISIAVGFGAQSVVEDFFRGIFMLAEDQFGVGDRIDVGVVNGTVERMTLRSTVIRDPIGTLWHVPNSEIDFVANETQKSSRATVLIGVSYGVEIDKAIEVLEAGAEAAADDPDWSDMVARPPEVQGVFELGDDAVYLRVITWVDADERRRFERFLRQQLKEALDEADIEMPNRQIDVWLRGQETSSD
jgi:small conductance mechanosensitive channel